MVGVAGKSKGCATCRKRKIKCDETKPICKRCEKSKLQCDRYERFPVFIDRSETGFRKRAPFEEVKPYPELQRIFSPEAESIRLISWFREGYVRSPPSQHALQTQVHWMGLVGARSPPHPALKAALLAMSFAKWSKVEGNPDLKQNGRRHYQQSLELTQKALLRTEDALSDDILATACIMTLYELSDPSSQRSDSWLDHIAGVGHLICLRGPNGFNSMGSRAMFEHMRHIFMVRCLAIRAPCIFGSPSWQQLPWSGVPKSVEQQIFDQGLRLVNLWESCDSLSTDESWLSKLDPLLCVCINIFEILDFHVAQMGFDAARTDTSGEVNPATLLLSITALGIQLGAATCAQKLLTVSDISVTGFYAPIFDPPFETRVKAESLCKARRYLARRILSSIETRTKMQIGALGILRMKWSLQLAQEHFTSMDPEMEQCKAILTSLSQRTSPFDVLGLPLGKHASSPVYRSS